MFTFTPTFLANLRVLGRWLAEARLLLLLVLGLAAFSTTTSTPPVVAQGASQWYMVDPHTHSVVSAEAFIDVGVHAMLAQNLGYSAIFLTDHDGGSSFQISNLHANNMRFEDSYTRWESGTFGTLSASVNSLATTPVNSGSASLYLRSASTQYGETHVWTKRGPTFRSGDIILKVSIYPVRIDPNAGAYVSVAIGGDQSTNKTPAGYTTAAGVISPGKSTVLIWQLGNARVASTDPNARILVYPLSYTLNSWNHYIINVSAALNDIPVADRPLDYNALTYVKMAVGAENGAAEAYFDTFSLLPTAPVAPANEYIYRTSVVDDFDTATYKVFPSYEAGQQRHTQRFNFGITDPAHYISFQFGTDSIPGTHQSGYPAQMNHPDVTVSTQEVINNLAYGADFLEVREDAWAAVWDALLAQNLPLIGAWSSDTHTGLSAGKGATFLYAPTLTFDALMKAFYEGRAYNALNTFTGRVLFNPGSSAAEPYPARYPVYVSDAESSIPLHLNINTGLSSSWTISWLRNGTVFATTTPNNGAFQGSQNLVLNGATTAARVVVRTSSSSVRAATQAILFRDVAGLPTGRRFSVTDVTTADGRNYTNDKVKGITNATWSGSAQLLQIILENPLNALAQVQMVTPSAPQRVKFNGVQLNAAASLPAFQTATTNAWYYHNGNQILYLKVRHATVTAQLDLEFGVGGDTTPPTVPSNLSATAINLSRIDLSWSPAIDNVALGGYTIRRDGAVLTTVNSNTVSYSDLSVLPSTAYVYTVDAFDTSNNFSAQSAPAGATTPNTGVFTFTAEADSYVDNTLPTSNFGTQTTFRADASPLQRAYLRFNIQGLVGNVVSAKVRLFAETTSPIGYQLAAVSDNSWSETGINFSNAPALGATLGASGGYSSNSWTEIAVTPQVTGNGQVSFGLFTTSNTVVRFTSRQGASSSRPQLVVSVSTAPLPTATATATATPTPGNTPSPTPTSTSPASSLRLTPVADAYVDASLPANNFGSATSLRTDASPLVRSFLRFDVQGVTLPIVSAKVRIFAETNNSLGFTLSDVADDMWSESTITATNAPAIGAALGSSGVLVANTWREIDVTAVVTGNGPASFALTTASNTLARYASRETTSGNRPELVIELAASGAAVQSQEPAIRQLLYLPLIVKQGGVVSDDLATEGNSEAIVPPVADEETVVEPENTVPANAEAPPTETPTAIESENVEVAVTPTPYILTFENVATPTPIATSATE